MNDCRCGRPTRDAAYVCDTCASGFTQALAEIPWLVGELETTLTGRKGIDYRTVGGTPSSETRLPLHLAASGIRTDLHAVLTSWVKFCHDKQLPHQSPSHSLPIPTTAGMSRWLMWRTDALTLHEIGPDAVDEITTIVRRAMRLIDRPADRWYAGPCDCGEDLYARMQKGTVRCHVKECRLEYDVAERRAWLLDAAEDRLADVQTISRAVSWLGSQPINHKRIQKWSERGRIVHHGHDGIHKLYRIGDVLDLLQGETKVG